jgi:hypothetical protein
VRLGHLGYSSQVQRESAPGRFRRPHAALTGASDVRHLQRKVRWLSGPLRPRRTGARSVRPSRGRRFVKTCACDHGRISPERDSPGRCSKTANRRRTSTGAATSGRFPDPAWCWHSFAGRKPSVGSSALPAGGHLVHGKLPGGSSSEPRRGVDARESAEARACCVRSVSGKGRRMDVGRADVRRVL